MSRAGRARGDRPKSCDLPCGHTRENRACVCVGCRQLECLFHLNLKISPVSGKNVFKVVCAPWRSPVSSFARKKGGFSNKPTVKHQNPVITQPDFSGIAIRRMTALLFARRACGVAMLMPEQNLRNVADKVLANSMCAGRSCPFEEKSGAIGPETQRYQQLADSMPELTEIAIEELEHFHRVQDAG